MAKKVYTKSYLTAVTAALIALAIAIGSFIYSFSKNSAEYPEVEFTFSENNTISVNPSGNGLPDHAPNVEPPTTKPPVTK